MVAGTTGREGGADEKEGFKTGAKSLNKLWIKKTVKKIADHYRSSWKKYLEEEKSQLEMFEELALCTL